MSAKLISREAAEEILRQNGWLSHQPEAFQTDVLQRSVLLSYAPGDLIYGFGEELGGIYGLVSGAATINTAPPNHEPQLINVGAPGAWAGEGCFLARQPRRVELRALVDTWLMYLPLAQMDDMASTNPMVAHNFGQIIMSNVDALIRVIHDLQRVDPDRRIASVLHRARWIGELPLPLNQTRIGTMARASRRQVNAALKRFAENGWLKTSYRSVTILRPEKLRLFATEGD
ncbi:MULTISPECIES: Crp/Fnr family transcriptional regulator [unclassified Beijerinckia]|uniref:Crp/Fnr family transcriptional regulator n=1 Tax=unclassified Beijerinckia TaxID=2638183 RepID=UPI00089BF47A|nr:MULTISPECIES: Crp/Fnr family transcriptional regulator [unclassified Beijerinckia]MDH7799840.1 CRP/FNR family cyclic AMP-dependent transcriptional regulator [Beijerinckia sp. GAS462]SED39405.1 cAMP-binding domain of CRP or a regulatory subunit of cAMP-dependent protein kinases [Beijerinckia sp. 28-YEA-48]